MRDDLHAAIEPLLIDYAAGTLDASDRNRVEAHLADCDECRVVLDEWQQIAAAARDSAFSRRALPPLDWHRIKGEKPMTSISRPKTQPVRNRFALPLMLLVGMSVAAVLMMLVLGEQPPAGPFGYSMIAVEQTIDPTPTRTPTFTSTPTFTPSATPQFVQTMPYTILSTHGPDTVVMAVNIPELPEGYWPYVVAKQAIDGGEPIQPDDFELHLVEIVTTPRANFTKDVIIRPVNSLAMFCGPMNLEVIAAGAGRPPSSQADCSLEQGSNLFLHYDGSAAQRTATPTPTPTFTSTPTLSPFAQQSTAIPLLLPSVTPSATPQQRQFPPTYTPQPNLYIVNGFNLAAIPPDVSPVIVAANNIENGAVIKPHDLTIYLIDKDVLPEGSQFNLDEIVYEIARYNIACGQILTLDYGVRNARDVPDGQPSRLGVSCSNVERTYRPGEGGVSRDYDGRLYPQPVGQTANVLLFARDLEAGSVLTEADLIPAPDYPIELVPQFALTDADAIIGQMLNVPVVAGQIVAPSSISAVIVELSVEGRVSVTVPRDAVDLPADARLGDVFIFEAWTRLPDTRPTAPAATITPTPEFDFAMTDAVLVGLRPNTIMLAVQPEEAPVLEMLIREKFPIRLMPATIGQDVEVTNPVMLIDVNVRTDAVELPDGAQFGDVFDIYTELPDSQSTNGTPEPAIAIFGVVLKNQFSNFTVLTIRPEDESMLQALIREKMSIRLVPSP